MLSKKVILTGLRANNDLHIGHIFGALKPIIDMAVNSSKEYQINLFVPDLHSFTTPIDHGNLQSLIFKNIKTFVALGLPIDNPDIYIYCQSYIPAHTELTWILDCFTGFGEMSRMTQFKDKSSKLKDERVSVGLFNYPVLMSADILLYGATYVPVGDDQSQHLEFTRDIASRMNNQFGDLFVVPKSVKEQNEFFGKDHGLRIRDLQDPTKKMSKSDETGNGVIFLTDSLEVAKKKIMSATTDSLSDIQYDYMSRPGISNLLELYELLGGEKTEFIGQKQYGPFKQELSTKVCSLLQDFQTKFDAIDDNLILKKLEDSELVMNEQATRTLKRVQRAVGLR